MSDVAEDVDDAGFGDDDGVAGADENVRVEGVISAIGKEGADPLARFASALDDDMAIGVFGESSGEREHVDEGTRRGDAHGSRVSHLAENGDGLGGVFLDKDGNLGVQKVVALAVLFGDAGCGCSGSESLNGDVAGEREGNFAGVKDAGALVKLRFTEDGDTEEIAGSDEEAFCRLAGIRCCRRRGLRVRRDRRRGEWRFGRRNRVGWRGRGGLLRVCGEEAAEQGRAHDHARREFRLAHRQLHEGRPGG